MTPNLRIQLLGDFGLVLDGSRVTAVSTAREQSLLAYLLLHRAAPQSRQYLAFNLWPDSSEGQARTNLRNLLHTLRQTLPQADDFLAAHVTTIQWRPDAPCSLDVAEFEKACAEGMLQEAVDLYRGNLLPGCYEDWIQPERERLQGLFIAATERLVRQLEERRDYGAALVYVQRLLRHDPLREETHRSMIRLHALNGHRAAALRAYHACVTVLQRELEVDPDRATRQLYERLVKAVPSGGETAAAPLPLVGALPLVGRDPEWTRLLAAWHAAAGGKPHLLLLSGEAGIGKTRLAEELFTWASRQGIRAAAARCYEAEGSLAYAPVVAWLRARPLPVSDPVWRTEVARLLPELLEQSPGLPPPGPLVETWQRQRFHEALARAVLAGGQPLLLWLDDLQWCDRDTLEWLRYLLRFDDHAPLLILGTLRPEEFTDDHPLCALLAILRASGQLAEIEVGPLDRTATAELGERVVGHPLDPEAAGRLHRETEGNSLFVVEMMRAGLAKATVPREDEPGPARLPLSVQAVIGARLARLSPAARDLMNLAATIGRDFTFAVLKHASKAEEADLVGWLDELWRRRIVREQGDAAYDFSHDMLREAAYAGLSAARRRWLHRCVAEALEAVQTHDPDTASARIAAHYDRAGLAEQAIPYYRRAAEAARRVYANQNAIAFFRRALALIGTLPPDERRQAMTVELHETVGDVLHLIGQHGAAREDYQAAASSLPARDLLGRARLHRKIGNAWLFDRRFTDARQAYALAEAALGPEPVEPPVSQNGAAVQSPTSDLQSPISRWWQAWMQIQSDLVQLLYWQNQTHELALLIEKTRPIVERYGTSAERAGFFHGLTNLDFRRYRFVLPAETVAHAQAYLAAQQELDDPGALAAARFNVGFSWLWHGNLENAATELHGALELAERIGNVTVQTRCLTYLTVLYRKRGQVEEVGPLADRSLAAATATHLIEYIATARANQAWLAWRAGNLTAVEENGRAALALWRACVTSGPFQWLALWPLTDVALAHGDLPAAIGHTRALLDPAQQPLPDALAAMLDAAIQAWDQDHATDAAGYLRQAIVLAQTLNYL